MIELRTTLLQKSSQKVEGYIATEKLSKIMTDKKGTQFREKIKKGAFDKALSNQNIDLLYDHDTKQVLSSTSNDSLEIRENDEGLFISADINQTTYGKDAFVLIKEGLVNGLSFGFRSIKDSWEKVNGLAIRTIEELELFEVSIVRNPAYSTSSIEARNLDLKDIEVPKLIGEKQIEKEDVKMEKLKKVEKRNSEFEEMLRETRDLNTTDGNGAIIPENVEGSIVKKMEEVSGAFANVRKFPSTAGDLKIAMENDSVTGGFFGEGEMIVEEMLGFENVKLTQKRLGAAISVSNQLINDSAVDIESYATDLLARRLARTAEKSIFTGTEDNEFEGLIHNEKVTKIEADALTIDSLMDLYTSLHPAFLQGSVFYIDRETFNQIAKLKDGNGHFYLQNGVVNGKLTYTLFGVPVEVTDSLTGEKTVVLANLTEAYGLMVKKGFEIKSIVDTTQALRGSRLLVLDAYMDGKVYNHQGIALLKLA